jgi:hypothetical protein
VETPAGFDSFDSKGSVGMVCERSDQDEFDFGEGLEHVLGEPCQGFKVCLKSFCTWANPWPIRVGSGDRGGHDFGVA